MDYGFFTDEKLFEVFCQNKTKISTIEKPQMFLRHLKDNTLITDELYQKLQKGSDDNGVYDALEYIHNRGAKKVRKFWRCVDQEHILERYPQLSEITATLKNSLKREQDRKIREREVKKRRIESSSVSNQAGTSSQSTNSQKKKAEHVKRDSSDLQSSPDSTTESESFPHSSLQVEVNLWDKPKHKRWLPVTCGNKKALLDRVALYNRKRDCIKHDGEMISPLQFEQRGGKESSKCWKTSILCQSKPLKSLIEMEILKIPKVNGKFTLRK